MIRENKNQTPVIIISAIDDVKQKSLGLDLGADDYICKPFDMEELKSRIFAVIRRFHGRANPKIEIGKLVINPLSREVLYNQQAILLTVKEFDILAYIAMQHPKVVSAEELCEHLYDEDFDPFSSVLRVHLARLKKKLQMNSQELRLVNIRGKGYSLCQK